ncbi:MAG: metallophosphoesterase [Bacilli bacterium]|nr:metallophosphoesterase [Bacilli bacterium]
MNRSQKNQDLHEELIYQEENEKRKKRNKKIFIVLTILVLLFTSLYLYMRYISTSGLIVKEYKVTNKNLPIEFHGIKVIQFSDLHYGTTINKDEVNHLVKEINSYKPDIVVFTGDLIDSSYSTTTLDIKFLTTALGNIKTTIGKYSVRGNHDYNNDNYISILQGASFTLLDNSYDLIYYNGLDPILITGIGSKIQNDTDINKAFSYSLLENANTNIYTIVLLHEPDLIDNVLKDYRVDLALSGHSHNGQVRLPFIGSIFKIEGSKKYYDEEYQIKNTKLFISGGLGTSMYNIRFFNRPSFNLYRLTNR